MLTYPRIATLGENRRGARASAKGAIGPGAVISLPNRSNTSRLAGAQGRFPEAQSDGYCCPSPWQKCVAKHSLAIGASDRPAGKVETRCFSPLAALRSVREVQRGIHLSL